ncbi:MAG: metallophosphoesterase [Ignavibacteriales bacterium]|nr:metallophosphoesterase [Ignavibacteriales bacterium]
MTILHLSDLHFGWDGNDPNKIADRKLCLDGLISKIASLDPSWKPTIICISGDIGWKGITGDYVEAKAWIEILLSSCKLNFDHIVVCPGNHDVNRPDAEGNARPSNAEEADSVLGLPIRKHFLKPFKAFDEFCHTSGIPPMKFDQHSYLVGERQALGFRFITLNSSWFSKDKFDKEKLWIGLPHLKFLESKGQLDEVHREHRSPLTIALVHHPLNWLHPDETNGQGLRPNTWDYLARRCHVLLTGHTHGEIRRTDQVAEGARQFTAGATFAGAHHFNSFRLIKIDEKGITYRSFEFDPRAVEDSWRSLESVRLPYIGEVDLPQSQQDKKEAETIILLRAALRSHAERVVEQKSRLLRPIGVLPKKVSQQLSVRISDLSERFDSSRRLLRDRRNDQTMSVYEAVRRNRCTLILGDLGSGKSTLVGGLVSETMDRSENSVSVLIPLKSLRISGQFSTDDLLQAVDRFILGEAAPTVSGTSIKKLLETQTEVLIVFDGLDELNPDVASRLLRHAVSLPQHWPSIQIVASGRPVELIGVAYEDWGIARTIPLNDNRKRQFIVEELLVDGLSQPEVETKSLSLLNTLKGFTSLDRLAETPLAIRLIYPRLKSISGSSNDTTLGDLLYDIMLDRLGRWQRRDDKPKVFDSFEDAFTTPEAKANILGALARGISSSSHLSEDEAKSHLREMAKDYPGGKNDLIAEQALEYYKLSGLITSEQSIEFPIQPLWEMVSAISLATEWSSQSSDWNLPSKDQWRIVSFVGTVIRRRGWLSTLREPVIRFIQSILAPMASPNVPAACYIVQETSDKSVAIKTIECFSLLEPRPLSLFNDEWDVSANNIARTIWLSSEVGFKWLYDEYLNPRYPLSNIGSAIIQRVMENWTAVARGHLSDDQKAKLKSSVKPYLAAGEGNFFGILSLLVILVPEAFEKEERLWISGHTLGRDPLSSHSAEILLAAYEAGDKDIINKVLLANSSDYPRAALMWCEINKKEDLPIQIVEAIFKSIAMHQNRSEVSTLENEYRSRLGEERWLRFARWILFAQDSYSATGAAIALYNTGEERLTVLGKAFLERMHDGGYIAEAERILQLLVIKEGDKGIRWLVQQMTHHAHHWETHSGCWRILLAQVENLVDGPQLLVGCMSALGPYTLPRYPEIREAFRRVLNGKRGQEFREVFIKHLHDLNPEIRRGISVTLVSTDPNAYPEALVVAIQGRTNRWLQHDWHEWERFCLSLTFSASVLGFLKSCLEDLEPFARSFALAILVKGKMPIEQKYISELSSSLLDLGNWYLDIDSLGKMGLRSEDSIEFLWKTVNGSHTERAEQAASKLIELHNTKLTFAQQTKCIALVTKPRYTWDLSRYLSRIYYDHEFAESLRIACDEITAQHGKRPFLQFVLNANADSAAWKDVVWIMLCDDTSFGGSSEADINGQALIEYGRKVPLHARWIGEAARECLVDPRVKQNHWIDAYHWLAVIADEFGGLSPELMEDALKRGEPISGSAEISLIARLGKVPPGAIFSQRAKKQRGGITASTSTTILKKESIIGLLKECSRNSDTWHPAINFAIESALYYPQLLDEQLTEFAKIGNHGILIALVLRYCYGISPDLVESIPLLDSRAFSLLHKSQNQFKRLYAIWATVRASVIQYDSKITEEYLHALDVALSSDKAWDLSIASEILHVRRKLLSTQIVKVFCAYARGTTWLHPDLFVQLSKWLDNDLTEEEKLSVSSGTKAALAILNEDQWDSSDGRSRGPWAFLLFPVVHWMLAGQSDEEPNAVFLRGIKFSLSKLQTAQNEVTYDINNLLGSLEPLLQRVPPDILRKVTKQGLQMFDPSVRAFSRLLHTLGQRGVS